MKPYFSTEKGSLYLGDCLEVMRSMPSQSVNCGITSPPYWGLRDYGVDGQLGLEKTPEEYVERLVRVFSEFKRVLRDDGTLWLNLGDSYASSGGKTQPHRDSSGGIGNKNNTRGAQGYSIAGGLSRPNSVKGAIKPKDLVGIPWRVAFALQADGWYLRQDIIWHKPNPMPESVKDRCTKAHEYIFLLSKSPKYYFDHEAIKEPCSKKNIKDFKRRKTLDNKGTGKGTYEEVRKDLAGSRDRYMPKDFMREREHQSEK